MKRKNKPEEPLYTHTTFTLQYEAHKPCLANVSGRATKSQPEPTAALRFIKCDKLL